MSGSDKNHSQSHDPLHGMTLENILEELVDYYEWEEMARRIQINCFKKDPSIKSSLKFLRRTPWARTKVEQLFLEMRTGEQSSGHSAKPAHSAIPAVDPWAKHRS
ncbi:VF530 family protein [Litoribacillus peritrichatus]|uniref:DUF2132 domain-containing protein n=1 Tax=Litoribacillus peritrichatus TaxID=718191 RepID=A0ABP7MF82_9GAMM